MQSIHLYSISHLSIKKHLQTVFGNMGAVLSKFLPAVCWVKYFLCGGVYSNLSGVLASSNHIGLEAIHRFSLVKTKEEPLFQSNISLDSNFGIKIPLCWFKLSVHTIKYLSILSSFTNKEFKENTIVYITQTLCELSIFMWLIFLYSF